MVRKSGAGATSKISSSSALAKESTSTTSQRPSILKSAFTPSHLQLHLFASVIQSFESQQLRIHDSSSCRLRQSHTVPAGVSVTCLDWGYYGQSYREQRNASRKKRKRSHEGQEDVVVAYGGSNGSVYMFSPTEGKVVGSLSDGHEKEVKDFKFLPDDNLEAWSIGGDGKLVQWDLRKDKAIRSFSLSDTSIQKLCTPSRILPQILCASSRPFAIDITSKDDFQIRPYDTFKHQIHTLIRSGIDSKSPQEKFLAADQNRHINIFDINSKNIVHTLVAGGDVQSVEIHRPISSEDQILAIVTIDGVIELFSKPFSPLQTPNGDLKSKQKSRARKTDATIRLVSSDVTKRNTPVFATSFDGPNLLIVSVEGGVEPIFQKLRWQDEGSGELLFEGTKEVIQAKSTSTLKSATLNGVKDVGSTHVNDARTVVVNGLAGSGSEIAPVEIESSEDGEENDESEEASQDDGIDSEDEAGADSNVEMEDAELDLEGTTASDGENAEEPSFGDLLAARHPETISIVDALQTDQDALMKIPELSQGIIPSGMSLGTVLAQSLRTNDQSLLETCLHVTEEQVIQNTILRLESSLAANLLVKLAERLADRPGRYGHLLTWVQATMIAHGGAIASQVGVASKLRTLYQVLNERSKILPNILLLKGKLDMMSAQQSFRAQAEAHRRGVEDAPAMMLIEGEDNWSSDEDERYPVSGQRKDKSRPKKDLHEIFDVTKSSEDGDSMSVSEHETGDDESSVQGSSSRNINGVVDDEASVSGEEDNIEDDATSESSGEDEEEEDSSMDEFINDGEISEVEDEDDVNLDDEGDDITRQPRKKSKSKR